MESENRPHRVGFLAGQLRKITFFSGDVPTTEELELLKESRERVGMVIWARWILLGILSAYGIFVYIIFQHKSADVESLTVVHMIVPITAVLFVAMYNALIHATYRWISQIRSLNQIQLLFDLVLVTVMVHYSGGAVSWFWTMYMVLTLESALIMERKSDTYAIALGGVIAFGAVLTFEFYGIIPSSPVPFENNALTGTFSYVMIKWAWVSITNFCVAFVGAFIMETVHQREAKLREMVIKDGLTDLYNRRYFYYRFRSEVQRAKRYGRTVSLLLLDVDNFKAFNDRYGHLEGDALLESLGEIIRGTIRRSEEKPSYEVDIACRYGGEEFAVILPEVISPQGMVAAERLRYRVETQGAVAVAERIRKHVERTRQERVPVTVSIGVASYPEHGVEIETLIRAADDALYEAKRLGKNRVVVAEILPPEGAPPEKDRG